MGPFRRRRLAADPAPAADPADLAVVEEQARQLIVPGFHSLAEARTAVEELVEDDEELHVDVIQALAVVETVWAEHRAQQRRWTGLSDADRLESAFVELEASGVVARMSFTCCQTCGHAEIGLEVAPGAQPAGYVFFHRQDADRLADAPASLFLAYGAFPPDEGFPDDEAYEEAATDVGHRVVRALEAAGLEPQWDGRLGARIFLPSLDWRRRPPA